MNIYFKILVLYLIIVDLGVDQQIKKHNIMVCAEAAVIARAFRAADARCHIFNNFEPECRSNQDRHLCFESGGASP
jgi:hypothetical protein